jgi:ATP synthase protein I
MKSWTSTPAAQSLGLQFGLTLIVAAVLLLFSPVAAVSALLGGLIASAGNLLVVGLVFRRYRAAEAGRLATRMIGAELARLGLVAVAFGLVFANFREPVLVALFGTFLAVHLVPVWWIHRVSDQAMKR